MRKRATEAATTQMGRMGAEDPVGISGRTLSSDFCRQLCVLLFADQIVELARVFDPDTK